MPRGGWLWAELWAELWVWPWGELWLGLGPPGFAPEELEGGLWEAARCPAWLGREPTCEGPVREAIGFSGLGGGRG